MSNIDYEAEVKKVHPDAVCHEYEDFDYDDYGKCFGFTVCEIGVGSLGFGRTTNGEKAAWKSAYENLKNQNKL